MRTHGDRQNVATTIVLARPPLVEPPQGLTGRGHECEILGGVIDAIRRRDSRVLVVHGERGVGKTALLEHVVEKASDFRVVRAAGIESEAELEHAALHQLLAPMRDHLESLPPPQLNALRSAFGVSAGSAPDRFLMALGVLNVLCEAAKERPLVCVVDDEQWLDRASAQILAFVARRLQAHPVALIFAARVPSDELAGLPELVVHGLRDGEAGALLDSALTGPLDARVREQIVSEAGGNPLALLELSRKMSPTELAGGFGLPGAVPISGRIAERIRWRLDALPSQTRRLLQLAAADLVGEPSRVWEAAARLAIATDAATPAVDAGLIEFGPRVRFRHLLVRAAAYQSGSLQERQDAHGELARVTDPEVDPDRRAWHRAQAAPGPDEDVAADLEQSVDRAQSRAGLAAAAAFLERASALTVDPKRRAERALAAAQAKYQAGAPDAALALVVTAEAGPLDDLQRARVDLLRARLTFVSNRGSHAPPLLLAAARRLEPLDPGLARDAYLDAMSAAIVAGRLGGCAVMEVARAARAQSSPSGSPRASDLLLDGLVTRFTDGFAKGMPLVRRGVSAFCSDDTSPEISAEDGIRWLCLAVRSAQDLWDDELWHTLTERQVKLVRAAGALAVLPIALQQQIFMHLHTGDFASAAALAKEVQTVNDVTDNHLPAYGAMALAGWRGRQAEASRLIEATVTASVPRGEGIGLGLAHYTKAVLSNGLGRYDDALDAAELASAYPDELGVCSWGLVELIEAAARSGECARAIDALARLSSTTRQCGTPWALGIEARSSALVSEGDTADHLYRESIELLSCSRATAALARAHLVYGEWLRRENKRLAAREQLRRAHEMFASMGAEAFDERTLRELSATGETARRRNVDTRDELTAQETQIARLARDGMSNAEVGAHLFVSPRTVEWHLRNVFAKLDIRSRRQLTTALASSGSDRV